jgi:hypothetical protein
MQTSTTPVRQQRKGHRKRLRTSLIRSSQITATNAFKEVGHGWA